MFNTVGMGSTRIAASVSLAQAIAPSVTVWITVEDVNIHICCTLVSVSETAQEGSLPTQWLDHAQPAHQSVQIVETAVPVCHVWMARICSLVSVSPHVVVVTTKTFQIEFVKVSCSLFALNSCVH